MPCAAVFADGVADQGAGVGVGVEEGAGYPGLAGDGGVGDRRLAAPEAGDGVADLLQFLLGGAAAGLDRGRGAVRGHAVSSSSGVAVRVGLVIGDGVRVCGGAGELGGAEPDVPDPLEVVLGAAQVQGERVVEQAEAGQGGFQPVDGGRGRGEDFVQPAGGGVVGGAFGDGVPLLAFAPPVEQVGAGQHELGAVVAVQVPRAGAAVDDGLEGAEPALGRGAAPGQVDRERLGLLAGHRRGGPG